MPRIRLIVNPTAGGGTAEAAIPEIKRLLRTTGTSYDLVRTERPWHAAELAQEAVAAGVDVVVAVGGDGTANEVLNGLMAARDAEGRTAALGVLCVGRGNDFAFAVGIPHDLTLGCRVLAENHRRAIDVGRVVGGDYPQGRYFGNGVGIGFDAVVGLVAKKLKRMRGFLGYLVAALKTIFLYYRAPLTEIAFDGEPFRQKSLLISVMNGRRMGGGFLMAPDASMDDGRLDLCIAREVSRPRIFALIPRFMKGTQASHPAIRTGRTARVIVTAVEGGLPAHADGETLCIEGHELAIELASQRIEILCPPTAG